MSLNQLFYVTVSVYQLHHIQLHFIEKFYIWSGILMHIQVFHHIGKR